MELLYKGKNKGQIYESRKRLILSKIASLKIDLGLLGTGEFYKVYFTGKNKEGVVKPFNIYLSQISTSLDPLDIHQLLSIRFPELEITSVNVEETIQCGKLLKSH